MDSPLVFEKGDKTYLVAPVQEFTPDAQQIEEFAFAQELKKSAPNPNLLWLRGQYVEADQGNRNGQMWTADEISLKHLTPMFMPVTVMHDPRTAVGVIADVKLLTPDADNVPRAKIETALALWTHRFPEAAYEAQENARLGTLMQSMECIAPDYSCSECGMTYHKMPDGYERENWCAHLKGEEGANASRILGNVVFTGTGLIYGTRGAEGADPLAHLEVFQEEVAELHTRWHADHESPRRTSNMATISVEQTEWERVQRERDEANATLQAEIAKREDAESAAEKAEADKAKAETEVAEERAKREAAEEQARASTLRDERMGALGPGFSSKLGEKTRDRLTAQAGKLSDEEWTARLEELAEAYGVSHDADLSDEDRKSDDFTSDEIAGAGFGSGTPATDTNEPTVEERRAVMSGLYKS